MVEVEKNFWKMVTEIRSALRNTAAPVTETLPEGPDLVGESSPGTSMIADRQLQPTTDQQATAGQLQQTIDQQMTVDGRLPHTTDQRAVASDGHQQLTSLDRAVTTNGDAQQTTKVQRQTDTQKLEVGASEQNSPFESLKLAFELPKIEIPYFYGEPGACGQISFRVVPVLVSSPNGKVVEANAFLDDGSEQTYVNEDLVAELGIHGKPEEVKATVLNGKEERFQSFPVKFDISPLNRPEKQYGIEAITIKNVCGKLKPIDWCRVSRDWDHLKDIEFPKFLGSRNKVDILIGLDHAGLHESIHEVKGRSGEPIARLTPLGYTCVGPVLSLTS
ncbi:hypothetical protein BSL78_03115 [Apostichopus japonicus]|uniref:Uncharacterized protein n=1 Tax=Stichopus japonicus TaxID=307972 RepID=A0A2G8LIE9_STIJA|nr:hypothetical protein BSL78_03115 [Apostichopus japonicus]